MTNEQKDGKEKGTQSSRKWKFLTLVLVLLVAILAVIFASDSYSVAGNTGQPTSVSTIQQGRPLVAGILTLIVQGSNQFQVKVQNLGPEAWYYPPAFSVALASNRTETLGYVTVLYCSPSKPLTSNLVELGSVIECQVSFSGQMTAQTNYIFSVTVTGESGGQATYHAQVYDP